MSSRRQAQVDHDRDELMHSLRRSMEHEISAAQSHAREHVASMAETMAQQRGAEHHRTESVIHALEQRAHEYSLRLESQSQVALRQLEQSTQAEYETKIKVQAERLQANMLESRSVEHRELTRELEQEDRSYRRYPVPTP